MYAIRVSKILIRSILRSLGHVYTAVIRIILAYFRLADSEPLLQNPPSSRTRLGAKSIFPWGHSKLANWDDRGRSYADRSSLKFLCHSCNPQQCDHNFFKSCKVHHSTPSHRGRQL